MASGTLAVLLALVAAIAVATLPDDLYPGDPVAMRISAAALVERGELGLASDLIEQRRFRRLAFGHYFAENAERGRWYSKYGIGTTLLYVPPLALERLLGGPLRLDRLGTPSLRLILGLYQLAFVLLAAFYLARLAAPCARSRFAPVGFALATLFATFAWSYTRAQTSEVFQLAFFLGFAAHLLAWHREGAGRDLFAAQVWLALLVLTKPFHVVLVPVLCGVALTRAWPGSARGGPALRQELFRRLLSNARRVWLPMAALGAVLLGVNLHRFGGPFETGYAEGSLGDVFGGDVGEALRGFLFGPQQSVFTHFPLLPLALLGVPAFWRRFRFELLFGGGLFLLYLVLLSAYVHWEGSWSYGPRYLLPVLPLASLPLVAVLDEVAARTRRGLVLAALLAVVLVPSAVLQWHVNGLPFLCHLYAQRLFGPVASPHVDAFFHGRHVGLVHRDLIAWRDGREPLEPIEIARTVLPEADLRKLETSLRSLLRPNYRWLATPQPVRPGGR